MKLLKYWLYNFVLLISIQYMPLSTFGEEFYWIGGEGNWSDTLHWLSENGGIPTLNDNVFFIESSFTGANQTVFVDIDAGCRNMDWSGVINKVILAGDKKLNINGSLILINDLDVDYYGDIYFTSTGLVNIIQLHGIPILSDLYFTGSGSWDLASPLLLIGKAVYLNNGTLKSNGWPIDCHSFYAESESSKVLELTNSQLLVNGNNGKWQVDTNFEYTGFNGTLYFDHNDINSLNIFKGGNATYWDVVFNNNATILDGNTFRNLKLSAQQSYTFQGNKTQTLTGNLIARGCSGLITIKSDGNGQAGFAKNSGDVHLYFVSLESIKSEMSAGDQFIAHFSLDLGNNQGCVIKEESRDMTWVNGTGFWSDTLHWSSPIGGEDQDCLPLIYDNVFFNGNSFNGLDTVHVDLINIACNNMKWDANSYAVFNSLMPSPTLTLYGFLEFMPTLENNFNGDVFFKDTLSGQHIKTANVPFKKNVVFDGENGGWTVYDSLVILKNVTFLNGAIELANNYVKCQTMHSDSAFARSLDLGSATVEIFSASPYPAWKLNNENLEFNSGSSEIVFLANGATIYNLGGDTIKYHNVLFDGIQAVANMYSRDTIYGEYKDVKFNSNAYIYGNNSFDTLSLTPGNFYSLQAGKTQIINEIIDSSGICTGPVLLQSMTPGSEAYLEKEEDTLSVEYTAIQDIHTKGEATFLAYNSIDVGNNEGWDTIYNSAPGKLYWVGGEGNWEETEHWSLTSGGPPGECIPTPYDTVIFDNLSFSDVAQKVSITRNNAFARNMDWTGATFQPEFTSTYSGSYLRIFGSLWLNPELNFTYPGYIYFESRLPGEVIETTGVKFHNKNNNVYFYGPGGTWTLEDTLDLGVELANKNVIYYSYGNLNTNNYTVRCYGFYSTFTAERILDFDSSLTHINLNWIINGANLSIPENNSLIRIDSGMFIQTYGSYLHYNDLLFNADDIKQVAEIISADTVSFRNINYSYDGGLQGKNSYVIADDVYFNMNGNVNTLTESIKNEFVMDTLIFTGHGELYGNDTASWVLFDSTGIINGNGEYVFTEFEQDGDIFGSNSFDTLFFTPGYSYILDGDNTQTIIDSLRILGNNCESVYLSSSNNTLAQIHKDTGSVFGNLIQMYNIEAVGNAMFDAGYFSENVNESNEGWVFHANPQQYQLGNDTSLQEGDTIYLCAENFNGNLSTQYFWLNLATGDTIGFDSCLMVLGNGIYVLSVFYDEGPGCIRLDTIIIECHIGFNYDTSNISCYGFMDGYIEFNLETATEPITYNWFLNDELISTAQNIYDLAAGIYTFNVIDSSNCESNGSIELSEPEPLQVDFTSTDACYNLSTGEINLTTSGGTVPYTYNWSNNASGPYLEELAAGIYTVNVSDSNFCPDSVLTIEILELPEIEFELEGADLICYHDSTGIIEVTNIQGGSGNYTDFVWLLNGYSYSNEEELDTLMAGIYQLTILDDFGCANSKEIQIYEPDKLILDHLILFDDKGWGYIELNPAGGIEPYDVLWQSGESSFEIGPLTGGEYQVVINDQHGCEVEKIIFVEVHTGIFVPTAFSPNNDIINDEFEIRVLGTDLMEYDLSIYNRYGDVVFTTKSLKEFWNGRKHNAGEDMPVEVYTWVIKVKYTDGKGEVKSGNVTLLR